MAQLSYSSMAAFVAHYRALQRSAADGARRLSSEDRQILAAMQPLIERLAPQEQAALLAITGNDPQLQPAETMRRGRRAAFKLRQVLQGEGVLHG